VVPKLNARQRAYLTRLHQAGEHSIGEIAELVSVSRATVYREIARAQTNSASSATPTAAGGVTECAPLPGVR
jgi:IS30 family transposase